MRSVRPADQPERPPEPISIALVVPADDLRAASASDHAAAASITVRAIRSQRIPRSGEPWSCRSPVATIQRDG